MKPIFLAALTTALLVCMSSFNTLNHGNPAHKVAAPKCRVDYLQVDEDAQAPGANNKCTLYMYGAFGMDPGKNKSVSIAGKNVEISMWSPTMLMCKIDGTIAGDIKISANGVVCGTSKLRKWTGIFTYERFHGGRANMQTPDPLKEVTEFTIVYRGFGAPCPAKIMKMPIQGSIAEGSEAHYTLQGNATVVVPASADPCMPTTSVALETVTGVKKADGLSTSNTSRFKGYVTDIAGGIQLKIDYVVENVASGIKVKRKNCRTTSYDPPKSLNVQFEGFNNKPFDLVFSGTNELKLKQTTPFESAPNSSTILIGAWDGTGSPSHYQTDGGVPAKFFNHESK